MELICKVEGCARPRHAREVCRLHYDRLRATGTFEPRTRTETCTITGCNGEHLARGWCHLHYQRWQRHGDPEYVPEPVEPGVCSEEGCEAPVKAQARCKAHYAKRRREVIGPCSNGCPRPLHARGMCQPCYRRWKYGDPTPPEPKVSVEPLLAEIEARGGLDVVYAGCGLTKQQRSAVDKMLRRAIRRGHLAASSADKVAIEVLRTHPCLVYGEVWWGDANAEGFLEPRSQTEELIAA